VGVFLSFLCDAPHAAHLIMHLFLIMHHQKKDAICAYKLYTKKR
jgi:hypothetical protein